MKWYSTDSLHTTTAQRSPIHSLPVEPITTCSDQKLTKITEIANHHVITKRQKNNLVIIHAKNNKDSKNNIRIRAGSIHDLRRHAVSNLLKVPPQYTTFESTQRMPLHVHIGK